LGENGEFEMFKRNGLSGLAVVAGVAMVVGGMPAASDAAYFLDTFDRADNTDVSAGTPAGQSGTLGTVTYTEELDVEVTSNHLQLGLPAGNHSGNPGIVPNHNFNTTDITTAGGFVVEFDADPVVGGTIANTSWIGFSFGSSLADATDGGNDTAPVFGSSGGVGIANNGKLDYHDGVSWSSLFLTVTDPDHVFHMKLTVSTTAIGTGLAGTYNIDVDGVEVVSDLAFNWKGSDNYFNLESNVSTNEGILFSVADNFQVDLIPEPASLALFGLSVR